MLTVGESGGRRFSRWTPFPGKEWARSGFDDAGGTARSEPRQTRSWAPSNGPAAVLALIRRSDEHWHGLAVWLSHSGMDRDADLLDRLAGGMDGAGGHATGQRRWPHGDVSPDA
jgi:hypothetical protein